MSIVAGTGKTLLNKDGSGKLANGAVSWTKEGDVTFSGKVHLNKVTIERGVTPWDFYKMGRYGKSLIQRIPLWTTW